MWGGPREREKEREKERDIIRFFQWISVEW